MSKNQYFNELSTYLSHLKSQETYSIIDRVQEESFINNLDNYHDLVKHYDYPEIFASKIYIHYAKKHLEAKTIKDNLIAFKYAFYALFNKALEHSFIFYILAFSFGISFLSIIFSFLVTSFALFMASISSLFYFGIKALFLYSFFIFMKCLLGSIISAILTLIFTLVTIHLFRFMIKTMLYIAKYFIVDSI